VRPDSPFRKSARIVGEVLGKFHPHGDMAVYDAMARMAQPFSMRYPLIEGQGNFGSIDGDPPAAMRYTEARLTPLAMEMLHDLGKETVPFVDNFDPNLLVNGATGIAVGMSTSIPPHNMAEVCDALIFMLENWTKQDSISIDDLMRFIPGPDFPTGGIILKDASDGDPIASAYGSGRGKITVQARAHVEDMGRGRARIIVTELPYQTNKSSLTELPYQTNKSSLIERIADLAREADQQIQPDRAHSRSGARGQARGPDRSARRERPRRVAHRYGALQDRQAREGLGSLVPAHTDAAHLQHHHAGPSSCWPWSTANPVC